MFRPIQNHHHVDCIQRNAQRADSAADVHLYSESTVFYIQIPKKFKIRIGYKYLAVLNNILTYNVHCINRKYQERPPRMKIANIDIDFCRQ
jgi:transposase